MRIALVVALLALAGCATEKLASAPPPGVDFSGLWKLNDADSDDPMHLLQSQNAAATAAPASGQGGQGGQGGRGGRGGGRGGSGFAAPGAIGPAMPPFNELSDGLRWPAKEVQVKQSRGSVTIVSAGITQVCQPGAGGGHERHHQRRPDAAPSRDMPARDRGEGPPPTCGWDDKTLVVQTRDTEDEAPPFLQRYSLSEDGRRLIEIVTFRGGRSGGFSVSRVWDRLPGAAVGPSTGGDAK